MGSSRRFGRSGPIRGCSRRVRILIADEHTLFAEAIRVALEGLGMSVVGIVSSGTGALAAVERSRPDLILMDTGLPDGSGLSAGHAILERWPDARIIALTAQEDRFAVDEALRLGFRGYVSKDISVSKFANWIRMVLDGHLVFPQRVPPVRSGMSRDDEVGLLSDHLSRREGEVLTLAGAGGGRCHDGFTARHQSEHGAHARAEHPDQAPGALSIGGGHLRGPAPPRRGPRCRSGLGQVHLQRELIHGNNAEQTCLLAAPIRST